ncbi:thymosin beta-4 family protein [Onchocerca flexuosa]|uniref:Thymosin beta-4 family protein n=1 Tax=Onchocerca flexuosa TaxID=387005 RepID=A0A238BYC8_9BILA|nr:thymosin beta-4 family protein [Onchocerca flexuosa]
MEEINDERLDVNKEKIPKLPLDIAAEVTKGQQLKHVEISEKNILPTTLDIYQEKIDCGLKEEIKMHDRDVYREKVDENLKGEIKTLDTNKLRHAEVVEKNILPTSGDIAREKVPELIVKFDTEKLKHVDPVVKIALPSADDVIREQEELKIEINEKNKMAT